MPVKLLASDLDDTLVADLHTIPARTRAAIEAAIEQGVYFVIATGRGYEDTKKFIDMLNLTTPVICYQGSLIFDPQTNENIFSEALTLPLTHQLIDLARAQNLALNFHINGKVYTEYSTAQSQAFFSDIGTPQVKVADLKQALTTPPIKALIIHPVEEIEAKLTQLQTSLGDRLNIFRSLAPIIEVTARNVSKGHALEALAAHYGIAQSEVMAIGDQDNDVEMIAWAGLGVAIGNASPKVKAAANYIAPPLEEEGAAWAIEHFVLGVR